MSYYEDGYSGFKSSHCTCSKVIALLVCPAEGSLVTGFLIAVLDPRLFVHLSTNLVKTSLISIKSVLGKIKTFT